MSRWRQASHLLPRLLDLVVREVERVDHLVEASLDLAGGDLVAGDVLVEGGEERAVPHDLLDHRLGHGRACRIHRGLGL